MLKKKKRTSSAKKKKEFDIMADYRRIRSKPYPTTKGISMKKAIELLDQLAAIQ